MICGNVIGVSFTPLKTIVLTDEHGNEFFGVVTDSEVILTATDSDVIAGKVYASNEGVSVGTLEID